MTRLILASGSATRRRLLADAGIVAEAMTPDFDEAAMKAAMRQSGANPAEVALALASGKAKTIAAGYGEALVIGADQLLECEGRWFDKPADATSARENLFFLRGRTHILHTAAVLYSGLHSVWRHIEQPRLTMRPFDDAFLEDYTALEAEQLAGSVGAYRLEGRGVQLFSRVEGDFFAILGLPLLPLLDALRAEGALSR